MGRGIIFHFLGYKLYISARTHSISGLKSLEIDIFDIKITEKSGLEFFIQIVISRLLILVHLLKEF